MGLKSMIAAIKKLSFFDTFQQTSTYFTGTMAVHALGIVTMPIYTHYFSKDAYGIINVFLSFIPIFYVLLSFNLSSSIQRYYFEKDKNNFDTFLGTIFFSINLSFGILGSIIVWQADYWASLINIPSDLIFWLILMSYFSLIYIIFNYIMVVTKQSKKHAALQVISQYSKFAFTLGGIYYLIQINLNDLYWAKIIGECTVMGLVAFYTTNKIWKYLSFKQFSFLHIKYALSYGLPLIPFSLSSYILTSFDQIYINVSQGNSAAGLYSFAYKIGLIYLGLITALLNGSAANYFKFMNNKDHKAVYSQVDSMSKLLILGGGFLMLFAIDAGTLLSGKDDFLDALPIAPIIIAGYLFYAISSFYNRGIFYQKKNIYLSVIILASGIVNIFLNVYYIPLYGYQAAAYTTLVSYILMMLLSILTTKYILKLPSLPLANILKYIVFLAIIISFNYIIGNPNVGLHFGWICFKMLLFILLGFVLFYNKITLILNKKNS